MKWLGYLGYGPRGSQQTAVSTDYVVISNGTTFPQYHVSECWDFMFGSSAFLCSTRYSETPLGGFGLTGSKFCQKNTDV